MVCVSSESVKRISHTVLVSRFKVKENVTRNCYKIVDEYGQWSFLTHICITCISENSLLN